MASWLISFALLAVASGSDCTVVPFTATWCQPCKQVQPSITKLQQEGWVVRPVDVDREPTLVQQFKVQNLPTIVILSGGKEVDRIVGAAGFDVIKSRVQRAAARGQSGLAVGNSPSQLGQAVPESRTPTPPIVRGQSPSIGAFPRLASQARDVINTNNALGTLVQDATSQLASSQRQIQPPSVAQSVESSPSLTPQQAIARAAAATVRIRVDEQNTTAFGTGTVVDVHGSEALVLTCGHLFRNMTPGSQLTIDLYQPNGQILNLPAQLIDFKAEDADIGLVSFNTPIALQPVEILPRNLRPDVGQSAFSFGCDHGADPTKRDTKVKHIDRYIGASNIEIFGAPAVGRSGGGLFDMRGRLIGVCNAADATDDEGIYAAANVVYQQIERVGLSHLFGGSFAISDSVQFAANQRSVPQPANIQAASFGDSDLQGQNALTPSVLASSAHGAENTPSSLQLADASGQSLQGAQPAQLICIVRSATGQEQVVTIDSPTMQLLDTIQRQAH